jgi:hypothetical protein
MTFVAYLAVSVLLGCSTSITMIGSSSTAVSINKVQVLYEEPSKAYETIALINDSAGTRLTSVQDGITSCREKAATIGADAIIVLQTKGQWTGVGGASVDAKAIRWAE